MNFINIIYINIRVTCGFFGNILVIEIYINSIMNLSHDIVKLIKKEIHDCYTFYFFGEFGWFNIFLLRGLAYFINYFPEFRFNIITYKTYSDILKLLFNDNIVSIVNVPINSTRSQSSSCLDNLYRNTDGNLMFFLSNIYKKIHNINDNNDLLFDLEIRKMKPLYNLQLVPYNKESNLIGIFPRFRKNHWLNNQKLFSLEFWNNLINYFTAKNKKIVVFGDLSELFDIENKINLIYPKNIIESIEYLNKIEMFISPCSGFASFAQNCNTKNLIVIINNDEDTSFFYKGFTYFDTNVEFINNINDNFNYFIEKIEKNKEL